MGKLRVKPGIVTGDQLQEVYQYCKSVPCALPAVNVVGSNSINAAMQSAREAGAPIIIQFSAGGGQFNAGKFLDNTDQAAAVAGSVAGAHHIKMLSECYGVPVILHTDHCALKVIKWVDGLIEYGERHYREHGVPLFSSHMLDLSEEPLEENLRVCREYLGRLSELDMALEIELGVTGGEEDGVDHSGVDSSRLYTQPEEVLQAYDTLEGVGRFTIAAAFGNTHGVYKPGNVKLRPEILKQSQETVRKERSTKEKPLSLVFHGGSGSTEAEITEAVSYGVVKMNIDTDTQWAFTRPIKEYMDKHDAYLHSQIGNPEGPDKPNKKQIDPRAWLHAGEKGMVARLVQAFDDLGSRGQFDFG